MGLRRLLVIGTAVIMTIIGTEEMYRVFAVNGVTALAIFVLAVFLALFGWIALSFTSPASARCLPAAEHRLAPGRAPICHVWSRAPRC